MAESPRKTHTRREFTTTLGAATLVAIGLTIRPRPPHTSRPGQKPHPEPRPGVDGSRVLAPRDVPPRVRDVYDGIRQIPQVADGIRCQCGCADQEGFRSLLTCFEGNGMAAYCEMCQTEGRMVVRLHTAGRTLDQIRAAVDARFG